MKKLSTLLILILISGLTIAQIQQNNNYVKKEVKKIPVSENYETSSKSPTDTLTYDDFFSYGQPSLYSYNPFGYVFGTGWDSAGTTFPRNGVAQGFLFSGGSYNVEEALIWVGAKSKLSANGSQLIVKLRSMDSTSSLMSYSWTCPGTTLRTVAIPWNSIDTSSMFTKAVFSPSAAIFDDFAIHIDFSDFMANNDTIGFVSGADGTGSGIGLQEYTMFKFKSMSSGNSYWSDVAFFYSNLDVCLAIWPVVDKSTASIGGEYFANGIKLGQNFPNPGINSTIIEYELENSSDVTIEILDQKGGKVIELNEGNKTSGKHSTTIDLTNFSTGIYYYSLKAGKNRLTKKMTISQ